MPRRLESLSLSAIMERVSRRTDAPFTNTTAKSGKIPTRIRQIGSIVQEQTRKGSSSAVPDGLEVVRAITQLTGGDPLDKIPNARNILHEENPR